MLEKITAGTVDATSLDRVYEDCQKLLKQMEIESINFVSDDKVRSRVRHKHFDKIFDQVQQHKSSFDRVRKLVRTMQQQRDRQALGTNSTDLEDNMGVYSKQER